MFRFMSIFFLWLSIAILIFLCVVAFYALGATETTEGIYQPYNFHQDLSLSYPNFINYTIPGLYNMDTNGLMDALLDPFAGDYIRPDLSGEVMPWNPLYYSFSPYNSMLWNPGLLDFPVFGLGLRNPGFPYQPLGGYNVLSSLFYSFSGSAFNPILTPMESSGIHPSMSTSEPRLVGVTNVDGVNICWFIMEKFSNLPYHLQLAYAFPAIEIPETTIIRSDGTCGRMYIWIHPVFLQPLIGFLPFHGDAPPTT